MSPVSRQRQWQLKHPEKAAAQSAVTHALKQGTIVRPATCSQCPAEFPQAHHEDYFKPLEVVWLCAPCHRQRHVDLRADVLGARREARVQARARAREESKARRDREARNHLIAEARRWRALTGVWPTATHWHTSAGGNADPALLVALEEFRALTGPWPYTSKPQLLFGSWAGFMRACGGDALGTCAGVRHGQRAAEIRAAIQRLDLAEAA